MATVSWSVPGTSDNWDSMAAWTGLPGGETYPGQVAANADDVTLGAAGSAADYVVTLNVANPKIGSLTVTGRTAATAATTTMQMTANKPLTITGTITLSNADSIIDGAGTISVGGAIGGTGTISAGTASTGGTLDLTGAGSLSSDVILAIGTAAATTLETDLAGGATSAAAINVDNAFQTLEVGPSGTLTINAAESVALGQIQMAGGQLSDASGITLGTSLGQAGFITGFGTVAAAIGTMDGSGTNSVTATGGTLDLTAAFANTTSSLTLAIDTAAGSTLKIDAAISVTPAIAINNPAQSLEVGPTGALSVGNAQNVTFGTIQLDGGSITDLKGISFGTGAVNGSLSGFGTVTGLLKRSGSGIADTITATGGTLTLSQSVATNSQLVFDIDNSAASELKLKFAPGTGNTFTFLGPAGDLALANAATFNDEVAGLNISSSSTPTNFIDIVGTMGATVTSGQTGTGTSGTVILSNGAQLSMTGITNVSGSWQVLTAPDSAGTGTDVFLSSVCYAVGTRILTAIGERAIESLSQGDMVLMLSDGELKAQPVKWLGRRRIDLTAHPRPEAVAPIRIRRGAFADNVPHTDLLVSPDHAVFVDGKLICARQLINGITIRQEKGWTSIDYCHLELDAHAILLAEGLPAESYIDTGNRGFFANSGAALVLHPDLTDEAGYPTREAASCAPFVWDEPSVQPVWQHLADRAAAIGRPLTQRVTTTDADLRLLADRRTVKPVISDGDRVIFALPPGAREVRFVSRAQSPTEARPWLEDRRRLGIRVKRIVLRSAEELREIPVDHPDLTRGWWAVERDGQIISRWTDGEAVLPLPAMCGLIMLEIHLAGSMIYAEQAAAGGNTERRAA
jgi:hypothetical protein